MGPNIRSESDTNSPKLSPLAIEYGINPVTPTLPVSSPLTWRFTNLAESPSKNLIYEAESPYTENSLNLAESTFRLVAYISVEDKVFIVALSVLSLSISAESISANSAIILFVVNPSPSTVRFWPTLKYWMTALSAVNLFIVALSTSRVSEYKPFA